METYSYSNMRAHSRILPTWKRILSLISTEYAWMYSKKLVKTGVASLGILDPLRAELRSRHVGLDVGTVKLTMCTERDTDSHGEYQTTGVAKKSSPRITVYSLVEEMVRHGRSRTDKGGDGDLRAVRIWTLPA